MNTNPEHNNPENLDACQFTVEGLQSWYDTCDGSLTLVREDVKQLLDDITRLEGLAAVSPQDPKAR